ncbi:MAG: CRISPR-associated ring nuclease Csm6 [Geoalkalibacter sp.]|uniref:CRISPR-associated ring nuclease Csm6 n=1 Tax=Geoalkalibacter sp. TaxID=3041440 RepID=UPI003D11DCDC
MKTYLLAVCGLNPQVITETLYALHQQRRLPDAVRVLSTRAGREACLAQLFDDKDGAYGQFLREYEISPGTIDFSAKAVHAVCDTQGRSIEDIATESDNECFLRACMQEAFDLTNEEGSTVYFSIAGGRKTMGACLMAAAQCYGRPQDRLFHVLVSPEFESSREFFFPRRPPREITLYDPAGQPYRKSTRYAHVTLVPTPFIPARQRLSLDHLRRPESPASLLVNLVREKPDELVVDLPGQKIVWKGIECDLMPARLALYAFFALQKRHNECLQNDCRSCERCFLSAPEILTRNEDIASLYRRMTGDLKNKEMSDSGVLGLTAENFNSYKSKIRADLERAFGSHCLEQLQISAVGSRPGLRYGIKLDRRSIRVVL